MPWQSYAMTRVLERDTTGAYVWREAGLDLGRGNGKSVWCASLVLHKIVDRGHSVLGMAQNLDTAKEVFDRVVDAMESDRHLRRRIIKAHHGKGDAKLVTRHPSGRISTYRLATSARAARGPRAETLLVDEAAFVDPNAYEAAKGVQRGTEDMRRGLVGELQTILVGTPPEDLLASVAFDDVRTRGLAGSPGVLFMEWSPPDGADLGSLDAWIAATPALGYRMSLDELTHLYESHAITPEKLAVFAREYMAVWPTLAGYTPVIEAADWNATRVPSLAATPPRGIGIAVAPDGRRSALAVAWRLPDGTMVGEVCYSWAGTRWLVDKARAFQEAFRLPVTLDAVGPAGPLADELRAARVRTTVVTTDEYARACAALLADIRDHTFAHLPDTELDEAATTATRREFGDRWVWARRASDVTVLEAVTMATGAARPEPLKMQVRA